MRQYLASTDFDHYGLLSVTGKEYRYLRQVLRICEGDMVQVRTPGGNLVSATVARVNEEKKEIVLQVCAPSPGNGEESDESREEDGNSFPELWLFQCIARPQKMDLIVRQAAECGVTKIIPVASRFSQAHASERNFRSERFQRIIKEARQQSGSAVPTELSDTVTVEQAVALWKERTAREEDSSEESLGIVLYERTEHSKLLHEAAGGPGEIRLCALFCGSEGGISPDEIALLEEGGFTPVHFKTNILRCETAALYGIASVQSALTEKQVWQCRES